MTCYNPSFTDTLPLSNKNFQKIITFYLFECPVEGVTSRGETFRKLGWVGNTKFAQLKRNMITKDIHYNASKKAEIEGNIDEVRSKNPEQYCVFLSTHVGTLASLFKAIRNSLAHGSFSVKGKGKSRKYYFYNYDKYLKAEIVLKEEKLLSWIDIVKLGPKN